MNADLATLRENYSKASLDIDDVSTDPFEQFKTWFEEARNAGLKEPNAMILATCGEDMMPQARTVLLKALDSGFVFYSNYQSDKGKQLDENPNCTLLFVWLDLERQIKINGKIEKVSREEAEEYFHSRPRLSQIGAWASNQSTVIPSRSFLEQSFQEKTEAFGENEIPLPEHWGGYRVIPRELEFWQGRRSRLHDRISYRKGADGWTTCRLSP